MVNSELKQDISVDVVIPVFKPNKSFIELIKRISEQTIKVNNIYLFNMIDDKRYTNICKIDGISNFSYHDGKMSFNGIQLADNDIINFDEVYPNVNIINLTRTDLYNGLFDNIIDISEADYILYMMQNVLPLSKDMVKDMLEVFRSSDVMMVPAKQTIDKRKGFIERYEYNAAFSQKGNIDISNGFSVIVSALWSYNECVMYNRKCMEAIVSNNKDNVTFINEDIVALDMVINDGKKVVIADTYVKSVKRSNPSFIASRCYDLKKIDNNCDKVRIAQDFDTFKGLIKVSLGDIILRNKLSCMATFISYKIAHRIGYYLAKSSNKTGLEKKGDIMRKIYKCFK